jgi:hypothetical protein
MTIGTRLPESVRAGPGPSPPISKAQEILRLHQALRKLQDMRFPSNPEGIAAKAMMRDRILHRLKELGFALQPSNDPTAAKRTK